MRPLYETEEDSAKERLVATRVGEYFGCEMVRMQKLCPFDWLAVIDKTAKAIIEIKCRTNPVGKYPTYMISKQKWGECLDLADRMKVKFTLAVDFSDGLYYVSGSKEREHAVEGVGGRRDRDDPADVEPCIYLPMSLFRSARR